MKKVKIVYNPFLLTTVITVDGKKPSANSSLDFQKQRLQEWAEKLPKILVEEYRDKNISIEFTGTLDDFTDLKEILQSKKDEVTVGEYIHHRTPDVEDVETQIIEVYNAIQDGPVEALKDKDISEAFKNALKSEFAINVVATMSSGKSSLINAILGVNLMPVAMMATTATIVSVIATPREGYYGIAYNKEGQEIYREDNLNIEVMRSWNADNGISSIDIYGPIPCVKSIGMRLVLIDTPGPNNSRDENHKALTYNMLEQSEKSLVLFVMNAEVLNIDDEKEFLDFVCECMKNGGKQTRDRFIFAVNKLDAFKPKHGDNVTNALNSVKTGLDERDIREPNLFPVTALAALEIRTKDEEPEALDGFARKCRTKGEEFHFEKYYSFNHLPISSRKRLETLSTSDNEYAEVEVHTGIPSIEEAIRLYVNKYARTMKVKDLVDSFNKRLKELRAEAEIQERIQNNEAEKKRLDEEISRIENEISSGKSAESYIELIDKIDVIDKVEEEVDEIVGRQQARIDTIIAEYDNQTKMPKADALKVVDKLEKSRKDIEAQLEARVQKIFDSTFKWTYDQIISIYVKNLERLGFKSQNGDFEFSPIDFVNQEISDISKILLDSTSEVDEGNWETRYTTETKKVRRGNAFARFFLGEYKNVTTTKKEEVWKAKFVDYVDMSKVVNEYFVPMQVELTGLQRNVPTHIQSEADKLKHTLELQFKQIEKILSDKLNNVKEMLDTSKQTVAEIEQQKKQLEWMKSIIAKVNKLINY